ncbi:unnamed protein product [Calypogeia fissa]
MVIHFIPVLIDGISFGEMMNGKPTEVQKHKWMEKHTIEVVGKADFWEKWNEMSQFMFRAIYYVDCLSFTVGYEDDDGNPHESVKSKSEINDKDEESVEEEEEKDMGSRAPNYPDGFVLTRKRTVLTRKRRAFPFCKEKRG